jgi:hypothetical protein
LFWTVILDLDRNISRPGSDKNFISQELLVSTFARAAMSYSSVGASLDLPGTDECEALKPSIIATEKTAFLFYS